MLQMIRGKRPGSRASGPAHPAVSAHQRVLRHPAAWLQRGLGNQGLLRLAHSDSLPMLRHGLGNQATLRRLNPPQPALQKKLIIGESSDQYEQEADRAASQVMDARQASVAAPAPATSRLQRKCYCGGMCSKCRDDLLQRKADGAGASQQATAPPIVHRVLQSPGQELEPSTRAFMESRFGYEFGSVRVHHDATAATSAAAVYARAYTVGSHVVFGSGQYQSGEGGRGLLAHELTHVIQQSGGTVPAAATRLSRAPIEWHFTSPSQTNPFQPREEFHLEFYTHSCMGCHDRGHRILLRTITNRWDLFEWAVEQRMNGIGIKSINAEIYSQDVDASNVDREAAAMYIYFNQKHIEDEANARLARQAQYRAAQRAAAQKRQEEERKQEALEKQRAFAKSDPS
ncbi:MAG: DUF4157 domain-containing protein [Acidobacteria bacterium]|nr:DUF4157 domain-containing protein [Acidobacteriota bacterium]